jgi:hypothetical protein
MKESLLEKHEFMQQYVLNRATAMADRHHAEGEFLALQALCAWNIIITECKK